MHCCVALLLHQERSWEKESDLMYGYMPMYYFDPTYILILIGVLLSMGASAKLNATYGRYSSVASRCGMTGAQAAQRILQSQGIYDVTVRHVSGRLTDHYDPRSKTVSLSDAVYGSTSIAAIGVAAHECGHAIQDARDYAPLRLRAALVPVANFGSQISWLLIILGIVLGGEAPAAFQVTLPVEYNDLALFYRYFRGREVGQTRQVLNAAALTVAAAAASLLQLLRLLLLFGNRRRDD